MRKLQDGTIEHEGRRYEIIKGDDCCDKCDLQADCNIHECIELVKEGNYLHEI